MENNLPELNNQGDVDGRLDRAFRRIRQLYGGSLRAFFDGLGKGVDTRIEPEEKFLFNVEETPAEPAVRQK